MLANILTKMLDKRKAKDEKKVKLWKRADENKFFHVCLTIIKSSIFSMVMACVIIGNTVVQALDQYPETEFTDILDGISVSFSIVYFLELLINMGGQGVETYFQSAYNKFDCVIVVISMVDAVYYLIFGSRNVNSITALRMFRMMRVFKLAKVWRTFRKLLKTMWKTLLDIASFSIILFLFIYIYSILGMELFAERAKFVNDKVVDPDGAIGNSLDTNFDSFLWSFTTVFVVLTEDGWSNIFQQHFRAVNNFKSTVFFISLYIVGPLILLNLFLGILLEDFDEGSLEMELEKKIDPEE